MTALGENRTPDALLRTEALYPLSYEGAERRTPHNRKDLVCQVAKRSMLSKKMRPKRFELPAYRTATYRSNPLSYGRITIDELVSIIQRERRFVKENSCEGLPRLSFYSLKGFQRAKRPSKRVLYPASCREKRRIWFEALSRR